MSKLHFSLMVEKKDQMNYEYVLETKKSWNKLNNAMRNLFKQQKGKDVA